MTRWLLEIYQAIPLRRGSSHGRIVRRYVYPTESVALDAAARLLPLARHLTGYDVRPVETCRSSRGCAVVAPLSPTGLCPRHCDTEVGP